MFRRKSSRRVPKGIGSGRYGKRDVKIASFRSFGGFDAEEGDLKKIDR